MANVLTTTKGRTMNCKKENVIQNRLDRTQNLLREETKLRKALTETHLEQQAEIVQLKEKNEIQADIIDSKPLLKVPGELGRLFDEQMSKASFVAFQAPSKEGKTWMLNCFVTETHLEQQAEIVRLKEKNEIQAGIIASISQLVLSNSQRRTELVKRRAIDALHSTHKTEVN